MLRGTRELARRLPLASGSYPPRAWSLGAAGVGRAGTDGDSLRESTWRLSMCRQRRDASTSWREDTRPCYGGDARNHVGLEFKLTADDAQRALRKWAKCVPNTPAIATRVPTNLTSFPSPRLPTHVPCSHPVTSFTPNAARNPFGRGRSWTATGASPRSDPSSSPTGSST